MILAGIDIGTNTLRLLVAEIGTDTFHEIYSDRKVTRLGQDLNHTGKLGRAAEDRSLTVLREFARRIRRHNAVGMAAIGTSALRNASNASSFITEARRLTGLPITVVAGEEEARYTLIGVRHALRKLGAGSRGSSLIIDIGGGSTEIIETRAAGGVVAASLPLGAVYLSDQYIHNDPPTADELNLLRDAIKGVLEQQVGDMRPGPGTDCIGTAGTLSTLSSMDLELAVYAPEKINGHMLTTERISELVQRLGSSTLEERRSMPGLEPGREDIILTGAVVAQEIMQHFGFRSMLVSEWGLREGIVLDLYENLVQDTRHQNR